MKTMITVCLLAAACWAADCGVERQKVKTLQDADAGKIADRIFDVDDVDSLRALPAPDRKQITAAEDSRFPIELHIYRVHALLIGYKLEGDQDFHLVLASPANRRHTMIAEIPSPNCVSSETGKNLLNSLRAHLELDIGGYKATAKFRKLPKAVPVVIVGHGFFDFIHGQTGVAPNGIELHPVLSLEAEQ